MDAPCASNPSSVVPAPPPSFPRRRESRDSGQRGGEIIRTRRFASLAARSRFCASLDSRLPGKDGIEWFFERVRSESLELVQERPHRTRGQAARRWPRDRSSNSLWRRREGPARSAGRCTKTSSSSLAAMLSEIYPHDEDLSAALGRTGRGDRSATGHATCNF